MYWRARRVSSVQRLFTEVIYLCAVTSVTGQGFCRLRGSWPRVKIAAITAVLQQQTDTLHRESRPRRGPDPKPRTAPVESCVAGDGTIFGNRRTRAPTTQKRATKLADTATRCRTQGRRLVRIPRWPATDPDALRNHRPLLAHKSPNDSERDSTHQDERSAKEPGVATCPDVLCHDGRCERVLQNERHIEADVGAVRFVPK